MATRASSSASSNPNPNPKPNPYPNPNPNPNPTQAPRLQLSALPAATLRDLDAITAVDAQVFRSALLRLLCDIGALERATGQQVLCPAKLAKLQAATAHVPGLWPSNATAG